MLLVVDDKLQTDLICGNETLKNSKKKDSIKYRH